MVQKFKNYLCVPTNRRGRDVNTRRKCEAEKGEVRQAFSAKKRGKRKHGSSTTAAYKSNNKNPEMLRVHSQLVLKAKEEKQSGSE